MVKSVTEQELDSTIFPFAKSVITLYQQLGDNYRSKAQEARTTTDDARYFRILSERKNFDSPYVSPNRAEGEAIVAGKKLEEVDKVGAELQEHMLKEIGVMTQEKGVNLQLLIIDRDGARAIFSTKSNKSSEYRLNLDNSTSLEMTVTRKRLSRILGKTKKEILEMSED